MNRTAFLSFAAILLSVAALAAPAKRDPVAEGYLDWEVDERDYLYGRQVTPSDLRHRVVVYVVVDAAKFTPEQSAELCGLSDFASLPAGHLTQWETDAVPRSRIVVFSVRNASKDLDPKTFKPMVYPPKGANEKERLRYTGYAVNHPAFYKDLKPVGEADIPLEDMPVVSVYGGEGAEPLYRKTKFSYKGEANALRNLARKETEKLPSWHDPLGVADPQFFKTVPTILAKGKPAQAALLVLKGGIKSKNPDQAKEAQMMYDALYQYKSMLKLRIMLEFGAAPARAYYDYQQLVSLFPAEKKKLQEYTTKIMQDKEIVALGKIFEKMRDWGRDDFMCKNAGEAKKIVLELKKARKSLDVLAGSANTVVQGEAMLFQSQVDTLIEVIPTKVAPK